MFVCQQIKVGLAFYAVASRLEIHIISASNVKVCNPHNNLSDPYVKVQVWDDSKSSRGNVIANFRTKTIWGTLDPEWRVK